MPEPEFIELAVAAALKASPELAAIAGDRVYPLMLPQGATLPAVVYLRLRSGPHHTLTGSAGEAVTVKIACYALDYVQAKSLAAAVRAVMAAFPGGAALVTDQDVKEEGTDAFCVSAEFICQQHGG